MDMMNRRTLFIVLLGLLCSYGTVYAHFGMLIPSDSMIMQDEKKNITLTLSFSHPFEKKGMPLEIPNKFTVFANGVKKDLKDALIETQVMGNLSWKSKYKVNRPGVYTFIMEPEPYWEPAEDCFIIHYTKTLVAAFGDDRGWDREIGLKTEIIPLVRPFGLFSGNLFQGIVKLNGKPVSHAEVEVEYYNEDGITEAPNEYMITQTIKADMNGVFSYAVPKAGWWGFAALNEADYKLKHANQDKDVELGAVIWIKFHDWPKK